MSETGKPFPLYSAPPYTKTPGTHSVLGQVLQPPVDLIVSHQVPPGQPIVCQPGTVNPSHQQGSNVTVYTVPMVPLSPAPPSYVSTRDPPGLEHLTQLTEVLVHQKVDLLKVFLGCESNNEYKVKNSLGQNIYNAKEKNDCCTRNFCGPLRCLEMNIKDHVGKEVIRLIRPFRCVSCWYPCFLQEMEVQAPPGTTVGYVIQNWHPFLPRLSILGPSRELLFKVEGPCLLCRCCGTVKFQVKDKDGEECIGHIKKYSAGLIKRCFTDANNFSIKFPVDTDVKIKAVFLGACILIDFMYFEKKGMGLLLL